MKLIGRTILYTDYEVVDETNLLDVLDKISSDHKTNSEQIDYLFRYYKGDQPILNRVKEIRPEVNNLIVENRANEIVSFKTGYLMGEPVQYVARKSDEGIAEQIMRLNEFVFAEDKARQDKELADWMHICGTSYRCALPDVVGEEDEAPFEIEALDPRNTFVVYYNGFGRKPVLGGTYIVTDDGKEVYSVFTKDMKYVVIDEAIVEAIPHLYNGIPIIEYPLNTERLGVFEPVITILDAINLVESDRANAIEQFVQSLLVLKNCDLEEEEFRSLKDLGGLKLPDTGDAYYLSQELNQSETQTLVDHMYQTVLSICGMPNRNNGTSGGDTGTAIIYRDGYALAEGRAKNAELMFKSSEKEFLKLILNICNQTKEGFNLKLSDIEIRFTRRNYENILEKSQVLTTMLANEKIHPRLAFEHSGMFVDSELAYSESKAYEEENAAKAEASLNAIREATINKQKEQIVEEEGAE